LEFVLEKKFARIKTEFAIPLERLIAIRIKIDRSIRVGTPWSPQVVDFYQEMYPDLIEMGYTFEELAALSDFGE